MNWKPEGAFVTEPDPTTAWLDDCPPWCAGEQCRTELPEDRCHQSSIQSIPAITFDRGVSLELQQDVATPTSFDLVSLQRHPHGDIWIFIGDDEQAIELTLESAQRLQRHLDLLLERFR